MWANKIGVKSINMKFENKDPFFNINTKEDLIKAEKYLENDQLSKFKKKFYLKQLLKFKMKI